MHTTGSHEEMKRNGEALLHCCFSAVYDFAISRDDLHKTEVTPLRYRAIAAAAAQSNHYEYIPLSFRNGREVGSSKQAERNLYNGWVG